MYTGEVCPKDKRHLNDIQLFSNELKFNDGRRHLNLILATTFMMGRNEFLLSFCLSVFCLNKFT